MFTKDPEGVVGLDLQGGRVAEGTEKIQEVLKGQAVPGLGRGEHTHDPLPERVGLREWIGNKSKGHWGLYEKR